jgi:hypothetical protein
MDVTTGGGKKSKNTSTHSCNCCTAVSPCLMHTEENVDVPANGEANGTLCYLIKIHLNKEQVAEDDFDELINIDGFWVQIINA